MTVEHGTGGRAAAMRRTAAGRALGALLALATLVGACGGDDDTAAEPQDTSAPTSSTTTTLAPEDFEVVSEWTWTWKTADGYRTAGALSVGKVVRADDAPSLPGLSVEELDYACSDFDPDTDAVAPAKVTLTNDTNGFANKVSHSFYLAATETEGALIRTAAADLLAVAASYSDGVECSSMSTADAAFMSEGSGWSFSAQQPIEPDQTLGPIYAMLVLPDYFTPANPGGDRSRLSEIGFTLVPGMRTDGATLADLGGPDTKTGATGGVFWFSSLAGGAPGGGSGASGARRQWTWDEAFAALESLSPEKVEDLGTPPGLPCATSPDTERVPASRTTFSATLDGGSVEVTPFDAIAQADRAMISITVDAKRCHGYVFHGTHVEATCTDFTVLSEDPLHYRSTCSISVDGAEPSTSTEKTVVYQSGSLVVFVRSGDPAFLERVQEVLPA